VDRPARASAARDVTIKGATMQTVISHDGTPIAFDRIGSGPAVVLIGGAFSYRKFPKTVELARRLADRFTVINYDRRGRGDSGDADVYAVEREIEDLAAVIDAAGGSASLWGWSSGAVLALRAAAAGLPVERLALYEPPAIVSEHPAPPKDFAQRLDAHLAAGDRSGAVMHYMTAGMGAPAFFVNLMRPLPMWGRLKEVAHTLPYDWAVLGELMSGEPLEQRPWAQVIAPTLVMAGAKSPALLRDAAAAIAAPLPRGELRTLAGQGHNPSMKVQAPVVADFFGGVVNTAQPPARVAAAG
jgi:pimeloyl-ACP methyl ester carboxylesterase